MSKKKTAAILSAVVLIAAAVTVVIVFHSRIAALLDTLKPKTPPAPNFTPEEREAFADI